MQKMLAWSAVLLAVVAVAVAVAILLGNNGWVAIPYKADMPVEAGKVAAALFVVAVFLERALSVINNLVFGEATVDGQSRLRVAMLGRSPDQALAVARAAWNLQELSQEKQRLRLAIGFLAAVLIAGAGVRTFSGLLDLANVLGNQRTILDTMDILLTAGLLAGGSNGIAKIIEMLARRSKERLERDGMLAGPIDTADPRRLERAGLRERSPSPFLLGPDTPTADASFLKDVDDLDLAENARSAAVLLKAQFPDVIFTSGRRTVAQQANAMAPNILKNRNWIADTYAQSAERDALQAWVDQNPNVTTKAGIAAGLSGVMSGWTTEQLVKLSRHFNGLAFDVQPTSDTKLKAAIEALPNLWRFLDREGGLVIWHAEFTAK